MNLIKWLRRIFIAGVLLLAASLGVSLALRASAARRYLTAHLAASFGRPVDVSWFDFSLIDGGRIEGHSVTVWEDPRFGSEYFLRSDTLAAGLRWSALLTGRFEFGSVYLSRPSLNLVRNADGEWNIERWLPPASGLGARPGFVGPVPPALEVRPTRPARIDIDDGRINFKRGEDKMSFALVGVSGRIEQNGPGRWQIDLEARPMRAGIELQDIGTMRLRGSIAGTTARLQPAELALSWRAASLADALRLTTQNDYGIRGELDVDVNARIAAPLTEAAAAERAWRDFRGYTAGSFPGADRIRPRISPSTWTGASAPQAWRFTNCWWKRRPRIWKEAVMWIGRMEFTQRCKSHPPRSASGMCSPGIARCVPALRRICRPRVRWVSI